MTAVDVSKAVATFIAAKAASDQPFPVTPLDVSHRFLPREKLAELSGTYVFIAPGGVDSELATRSEEETTFRVDVAVVEHLTDKPESTKWNDRITALIGLVDAIGKATRLVDMAGAEWQKNSVIPLYDWERLKNDGVFLSVIHATYWVTE